MRPQRLFVYPLTLAAVLSIAAISADATVYYVDADSPNDGPGNDWEHAYHYLQDALAAAGGGDEIRVAQGIHRPDESTGNPTGTGARDATFQLESGLAIYGGYAGYGQPDPDARDIETYVSTLSGDLAENDGPDFANYADNSYHVVTGSGTTEGALLDGFTITSGNANGSSDAGIGGGVYIVAGSPSLIDCLVKENWAYDGAGR